MNQFRKTAIAVGVAQVVLIASGVAYAQTTPAADGGTTSVIVVGQRASLESAQKEVAWQLQIGSANAEGVVKSSTAKNNVFMGCFPFDAVFIKKKRGAVQFFRFTCSFYTGLLRYERGKLFLALRSFLTYHVLSIRSWNRFLK